MNLDGSGRRDAGEVGSDGEGVVREEGEERIAFVLIETDEEAEVEVEDACKEEETKEAVVVVEVAEVVEVVDVETVIVERAAAAMVDEDADGEGEGREGVRVGEGEGDVALMMVDDDSTLVAEVDGGVGLVGG